MSKEVSRAQLERVVGQLFDEITKTQRGLASVQRAQDTKRTVLQPGESIQFVGEDGKPSMQIGGGTGVEYLDGPDPAQPETPEVVAGDGVVTVITDGYDVDANPAPNDLAHVLVHFSQDPGFEPYAGSRKGSIDHVAGAGQVSVSRHAGVWYVCVQWETLAGKLSEPSDLVEVDVAPPVDAEEIEADLEDARQRIRDAREYADQQFDAFDVRVESAETDLNDAHDRIDAAEGALSTTRSDLDAAKADITAAQSAADQAVADALAAAGVAEGKANFYPQISEPTGSRRKAGNLWLRLPDYKLHYYDAANDTWVESTDQVATQAATDAAQAVANAADLQTKYDLLVLSMDGEGGLKDRLSTAENTLEDKAASSDLQELDDILRGTEDLPPQIADRFYAAMAIVEKLQAVSGWVGGVNLADGAVTAEKITATREMITKIMGAEWAYISEQLVVDGKIIANNADIISAVIKNLDVTEQSNFVDAFAEQLRTKEFTALVATMARAIIAAPNLIPGVTHLKDGNDGSWPSGFGINTQHPSVWIKGRLTVRTSAPFELVAGEEYHFSVDVQASVPGTAFYIGLIDHETSAEESGYLVSRGEPGTSWTSFEATRKITETKKYRLIFFGSHSIGADNTDGYQWFRNLRLQNMLDGRLTVPGSIDVGSLNVTEEMVASFARILHLVVDQIDVNSLWADTTWQNAGHFGSEDADQQTHVDGSGMIYYRKNDDNEFIPAIIIGGGDFSINLYDENGQPIGGISNEGEITGKHIQAEHYTLGGRPLFGDLEDETGEGPIMHGFTQKITGYGHRNMSSLTKNSTHWGFMEVQAQLKAGRSYKIEIPPFLTNTNSNAFLRVRYTLDGSSPNWTSTNLFTNVAAYSTSNKTLSGSGVIHADDDVQLRAIVFVSVSSGTIGFASYAANVSMLVTDLGPTPHGVGLIRDATDTNHDNRPLVREYSTGWPLGWYQRYRNSTPDTGAVSNDLFQGLSGNAQLATVWGGYQTTTATVGSTTNAELGRTIPQALSGDATLTAGTIRLTGRSTPAAQATYFRVFWHILNSAPNTLPDADPDDNLIGATTIRHGQTRYFDLPHACLDAFHAGQPVAFSIQAADGNTMPYAAIQNRDDYAGPIVALHYTR